MDSEKTKTAWNDTDSGMKKTAWEEMNSNKKTNLKQLMKPALIGMAIAGCYNFKDIIHAREKSLIPIISFIYRTIILVIYLFMFVKLIVAFFYLPTAYYNFNILGVLWFGSIISVYLLNVKCTSSRFGHYQKVFQFWEHKIMPAFEEMEIKYNVSKITKRIAIVLIASCLNIALNIAGMAVLFTGSSVNVFTAPLRNSAGPIAVALTIMISAFFTWILPTAFITIFSMVLQEAFDSFNVFASQTCRQNNCKMPATFQKVRLLHLDLSKLVSDPDQDLGWYYAFSFVFNMAVAVFSLYQVMRTTTDSAQQAMFIFWCVSCLLYLGLTAIFAAFLHESAHSPLDEIYYLSVQDITVEKLAQLNLFLSKLTGTQIGFSTCGLVMITKEFILTIAGVFLTYFLVLYTL